MKKKLRKSLALMCAGALIAATITACGGSSNDSAKSTTQEGTTTIEMAWWGNQTRNERTQEVLELFSETDSSIAVNSQFFQWDDYWSKMSTLAAGKKLPDIIQMDHSYIATYVEKDQLLDLTPYIESGAIDTSNISDTIMEMAEIDNGAYGIAAGISSPGLFYNKTVLDELGITMKDNCTMEEFIKIAKEVYEKTGYTANIISSAHGVDSDIWSRTHDLQITEKKLPASDSTEYTAYFELLKSGIEEGWHMSPEYITDSASVEQSPLVYGSSPETMIWCTVNGSSMLTAYQSAAPEGVELGLTTVPSDDPSKSNYLKASMYFSISANCENVDEAVKVLNYLINSEEAYEILLAERGIPASTVIAESITPLLNESEQKVVYYINDVVAENCSPLGPADPDGSSEVTDLLNKLEEKVGYGEYTPKQAADEYFTEGNRIYEEKQ